MQSISNGVGVTQFNGMRPKNSINIGGVTESAPRCYRCVNDVSTSKG
ncbi:hypothetical protein [Enterobacter phage N5822]|nr:hypothetical protein [Enterobacter phage N5822]